MGVTYGRKGITRIWDMKSISPVLSRNIKSVYTRLSSFHRMLPGKRIYNNCRIFIISYLRKACLKSITCYVSIWTCGTFELTKEFTSLLPRTWNLYTRIPPQRQTCSLPSFKKHMQDQWCQCKLHTSNWDLLVPVFLSVLFACICVYGITCTNVFAWREIDEITE